MATVCAVLGGCGKGEWFPFCLSCWSSRPLLVGSLTRLLGFDECSNVVLVA